MNSLIVLIWVLAGIGFVLLGLLGFKLDIELIPRIIVTILGVVMLGSVSLQ